MIDVKRRMLLKGSLTAGSVSMAIGAGLATPQAVLAAWNARAFGATDPSVALKELLGTDLHEPSDRILIKAPDIAENGAIVPVTVETDLEGVESITILAPGNPIPLIASFDLGDKAEGFVSTRIKMAQTADLIALVRTQDKLFSAVKNVKVTIGGCGS